MGEQWTGIDWTACLRTVRSLQRRIVKSIHTGHWRKVKRLCYLLVQNRQSAETSKRAMSGLSVSDGGGRRPPSPTPRREPNKQQDNECSAPSLELPGFSARRDSSNVAGASVPWAFVMLEPYAGKLARTVLRERGDGDIALLPGGERVNSGMKHRVQFISLEEDDKDLIVSFALDDAEMGVISLILLRTLFYEELMDEEERGVKVSLEGDELEKEYLNVLNSIRIRSGEIEIKSLFREYQLDTSAIEESEIQDMVELLKKQNYDNRFTIHIA